MAWMIVSDSSCEIRELENPAPGVQFALVPFKIRVGEREYVDLATLNTQQMLQAMTDYNGASTTACPSPEEWAEYFLQADNVFAFTISSNLSGSYNAAMAAREMVLEEHPEKKIFVLDTLSCSGALAGAADKVDAQGRRLVSMGLDIAAAGSYNGGRIPIFGPADHLPRLFIADGCDGAGIDDIGVCCLLKVHQLVALGRQLLFHGLGLILIDLTAKGVDGDSHGGFSPCTLRIYPL